jgi:hypothetical protein
MGETSMRTCRVTLASLLTLAATVTAAGAATVESGVQGLKLILLDRYAVGRGKAVYVAKGSPGIAKGAAAPTGDPPGLSGTVEIFPLSDPGNRAVYDLPADWLVNKETVAKYVNRTAGTGVAGAKVAVVKPERVAKLVAKNLGDGDAASGDQSATDLDLQAISSADTIRAVVTIDNAIDGNTYVFCSDFTALSVKADTNGPFKVTSRTSSAPATCGVEPTTTTVATTSTTTTTTAPGTTTTTTAPGTTTTTTAPGTTTTTTTPETTTTTTTASTSSTTTTPTSTTTTTTVLTCGGVFPTCLGSCPAGLTCTADGTLSLCVCLVGSTTTVPSTTTTTTTLSGCCGPGRSMVVFTTGVGSGSCGTLLNSSGSVLTNLACGGLYFGGGQDSVPLPAVIPDMGTTRTKVTTCDDVTGDISVAGMTAAETGSVFDCSTPGCFFGAPLPIPNSTTIATSTCVINTVSAAASGSANCISGDSAIDIPLTSEIYLTGDLLPLVAGIQPCPLCSGGTCQGGANDGNPCTPATSALNASYPTSHDCPPPGATDIGGIPIGFDLTTGSQTETAKASGTQARVFCGYCRDQTALGSGTFENPARACTANADCTNPSFPDCEQRSNGAFGSAVGGGSARTITGTGSPAGDLRDGGAHPAKLVSIFCIPPTFNATVDNAADLPGPGFAALDGVQQLQ